MALNPKKPYYTSAEYDELKVNDKIIYEDKHGNSHPGKITKIEKIHIPKDNIPLENAILPAEEVTQVTISNSKGSLTFEEPKWYRIKK